MKLGQWVDSKIPQEKYNYNRNGVYPILYRTINVLSNGDYALCCFDLEGIVNYNVMDVTIEEAWTSSTFKRIRTSSTFKRIRTWHLENRKTNKECVNCSF